MEEPKMMELSKHLDARGNRKQSILTVYDMTFKRYTFLLDKKIGLYEYKERRNLLFPKGYDNTRMNMEKNKLETLSKVLEKDTGPDFLRYLEDGNLTFSNNI